jgi:hypothetical protein
MRSFAVTLIVILALALPASLPAANQPPMRPYVGIGVLMLSAASGSDDQDARPHLLYQEPAILRQGELDIRRLPAHEWIFGPPTAALPLIVTARRGNWLRVVYDDAGREAWRKLQGQKDYQSWEEFFKGRSARLLPGLRKPFYQLFRQPGREGMAVLTAASGFRVITVEEDWALVMADRDSLGWLRWRDEDGRLLMGLGRAGQNR